MSGHVMRPMTVVLLAGALACASTQETKILPPDQQFARASEAFQKGDYARSITDFQTFTFNYPQDPRVPAARWKIAEAYFATEDWATAAQEYLNYQRDYPRDERSAEALFQSGLAYQHMSLRPELDQRDTERAVNVFDRLIVEYPNSEYGDEARERKAQLRDKLAEKVYLNAEFYYDNENYSGAEIYLTDLISQYTDTSWVPAAYALLAEAKCRQGLGDKAAEIYGRLRENYPDSEAARSAPEELSADCLPPRSAAEGGAAASSGRR